MLYLSTFFMDILARDNILVTGGTGFVGSHLVESLLDTGAQVFVLHRSFSPDSYFTKNGLSKKVTLLSGDLKDRIRIADIITSCNITFIYHLGAQTIVPTAFSNPLETLETNIMGTAFLLEAVRQYKMVRGIVIASSDKAYGKGIQKYVETTPLRGDHPYDVSKSSADLIGNTYFVTYGVPVVITRFGNIYGEGDLNFSRIIPGIISSFITGDRLMIRSDGSYIREYLYVKDVVEGYLSIGRNIEKVKGEALNFGTEFALSVLDIIHLSEKALGKQISFEIQNIAKNEIPLQRLDCSKALRILGWQARSVYEEKLVSMIEWYSRYFEKKQKTQEFRSAENSATNGSFLAGNNKTIFSFS